MLDLLLRKIVGRIVPDAIKPRNYVPALVKRKTELTVWDGPFRGMKYVDRAYSSVLMPKLLGTYEKELHWIIDYICKVPIDLVVDIGAAEGYYAVGMARRLPKTKIVAFEAEPAAAELVCKMAQMNGCRDRVEIHGECDLDNLQTVMGDRSHVTTFLICDVEGAEVQLLDPGRVAGLAEAFILVEMHDYITPDATKSITERFSRTHRISVIQETDRCRSDFPFTDWYVRFMQDSDLTPHEGRPVKMHWLWMEPFQTSDDSKVVTFISTSTLQGDN